MNPYALVIADLTAQRDALTVAIDALTALSPVEAAPVPVKRAPRAPRVAAAAAEPVKEPRGKFAPAVLSALRDANVALRLMDVCRKVAPRNPQGAASSVWAALKSLEKRGEVVKQGGAYTVAAA